MLSKIHLWEAVCKSFGRSGSPVVHMGPIHWHLKKHWHVPEALEEIIPLPKSLHIHLRWWLDPNKVLKGQPLHPLRHTLQRFTDASNKGWGAHLGDYTAKGLWSKPEGTLHINFLELKAVLLALKQFEPLCWGQTIVVCTDNTTVVSYTNKEGGMRSGSLCALLWRLLSWCNQRQIVLRARHIPCQLNVFANKLSRFKQVIQMEWSLLQEVFNLLCRRWHTPEVDLFKTKDHSIQLFTDASNEGWGAHLDQNSTKGLWSDREKRLHINVLELKAVSLDQCQNQTVLVAMDNSTVVAYINKQGGTHSAEMCALLWKIMTWCHHYHITLKARHIPGCLNVMADLLSRSNQVQSTEWSLHPQVFKQICQNWFTPHVDLFATHLNHKLPTW